MEQGSHCLLYTSDFTTNLNVLNNAKPVYKELKGGWDESIADCKTFDELPEDAKAYINFIEEYIGVPVKFIGTCLLYTSFNVFSNS